MKSIEENCRPVQRLVQSPFTEKHPSAHKPTQFCATVHQSCSGYKTISPPFTISLVLSYFGLSSRFTHSYGLRVSAFCRRIGTRCQIKYIHAFSIAMYKNRRRMTYLDRKQIPTYLVPSLRPTEHGHFASTIRPKPPPSQFSNDSRHL